MSDMEDDVFDASGEGSDDVDVTEPTIKTTESSSSGKQSALAENIARKGSNSYYYAHASTLDKSAAITYDGTPQLLAKAVVDVTHTVNPITTYSWADFKKTVKVYIDIPGGEALTEEAFVLNWTASTLDFRYTDVGGLTHGLSIPELHDRISGAVLGRKPDRITITLTKVATGTTDVPLHWYELVKKK